LTISRAQKTHAYGVDIPEDDGEKITTLGGQESPEYRFGGPNFFQFLKEKRKNFAIFWVKDSRQVVYKPLRESKKLMHMESASLNTMVKSDRR
jgi:hypothetical protein